MNDNEKIGMCRFDLDTDTNIAEVSINLTPQHRSKKLSSQLLSSATAKFLEQQSVDLIATIKKSNIGSIKCSTKSGFTFEREDNDNTPTIESASMLREKYGPITLAMLNYNAAGPYPSCFDNLTEAEKITENDRVLERNFNHVKNVIDAMKPTYILPFAGAYVLGGDLYYKNK